MADEISVREFRLEKRRQLEHLGLDPYLNERFEISHTPKELIDNYFQLENQSVKTAGRVHALRSMGKTIFFDLNDGTQRIQVVASVNDLSESHWQALNLLDIGDHVGIEGVLTTTKRGEKSVFARGVTPLSKCLVNLPIGKEREGERFNALSDIELRYRHRNLDLIANPEARRTLINRSRIITAVRRQFDDWGYLEVETPMLQTKAGGAAARTFDTLYNAYDAEVKLRISLELPLKRIICGDVPRVFELGRVFRNEGVSNRHNPEFTLLEFYEAYTDLEGMMERVETLFASVCRQVFGTEVVSVPAPGNAEGATLEIDFGQPWQRLDLLEAIERHSGLSPYELSSLDRAKEALGSRAVINPLTGKRIVAEDERHLGGLIEKLLEVFVEPHLVQPTFIVGYPIETSPLAKKDPNRAGFTRRFEGYILCREVCNAFSEINDPIDQRERFERQMEERAAGNDEAQELDEEFIYALECGMPPTGGCGIGMDRMVMLLTGAQHIREVLMFPMMKPEQHHEEPDSTEA